jgi:hypothetical protein
LRSRRVWLSGPRSLSLHFLRRDSIVMYRICREYEWQVTTLLQLLNRNHLLSVIQSENLASRNVSGLVIMNTRVDAYIDSNLRKCFFCSQHISVFHDCKKGYHIANKNKAKPIQLPPGSFWGVFGFIQVPSYPIIENEIRLKGMNHSSCQITSPYTEIRSLV